MTHVKALQAGHSIQGTSEPITPASCWSCKPQQQRPHSPSSRPNDPGTHLTNVPTPEPRRHIGKKQRGPPWTNPLKRKPHMNDVPPTKSIVRLRIRILRQNSIQIEAQRLGSRRDGKSWILLRSTHIDWNLDGIKSLSAKSGKRRSIGGRGGHLLYSHKWGTGVETPAEDVVVVEIVLVCGDKALRYLQCGETSCDDRQHKSRCISESSRNEDDRSESSLRANRPLASACTVNIRRWDIKLPRTHQEHATPAE